MKKSIVKAFCLTVLTVSFALTSCSSDDDNNNGNNNSNEICGGFTLDRNNLQGDIRCEVVLESGTYILNGKLTVHEGGKLIIKPGVVIEASSVSSSTDYTSVRYIAIAQGGLIDVQGTATNPVVMTAEIERPGSWGGLVICGKAHTNRGITASAEVSDLTYGGNNNEDSSGSIKYLRIEYAGFSYNSEKEFNGLSLFAVGNGTEIENVQVYESSDDGFEWFGGTVNGRNLVVTNISEIEGDDLFDWTEGWNGTVENLYGIRTNAGNRGIEADNLSNNHLSTPISFPTIKNLTLVGNGNTGSEPQAIKLRAGTKAHFDNVVLSNWNVGIDIQHDESISYVGSDLKLTRVKFDNIQSSAVKGTNSAGESVDVSEAYTEDSSATGAGNGSNTPTWTNGWTRGL